MTVDLLFRVTAFETYANDRYLPITPDDFFKWLQYDPASDGYDYTKGNGVEIQCQASVVHSNHGPCSLDSMLRHDRPYRSYDIFRRFWADGTLREYALVFHGDRLETYNLICCRTAEKLIPGFENAHTLFLDLEYIQEAEPAAEED